MEKNCFPYMRDLRVIQADSRTRGIAVGPAIGQGRDCRTPGNEGRLQAPQCRLPGPKRTGHGYVAYYRS